MISGRRECSITQISPRTPLVVHVALCCHRWLPWSSPTYTKKKMCPHIQGEGSDTVYSNCKVFLPEQKNTSISYASGPLRNVLATMELNPPLGQMKPYHNWVAVTKSWVIMAVNKDQTNMSVSVIWELLSCLYIVRFFDEYNVSAFSILTVKLETYLKTRVP